MLKGAVSIVKDGKKVFELNGGHSMNFLGEMKHLNRTDGKSSATVRVDKESVFLCWHYSEL